MFYLALAAVLVLAAGFALALYQTFPLARALAEHDNCLYDDSGHLAQVDRRAESAHKAALSARDDVAQAVANDRSLGSAIGLLEERIRKLEANAPAPDPAAYVDALHQALGLFFELIPQGGGGPAASRSTPDCLTTFPLTSSESYRHSLLARARVEAARHRESDRPFGLANSVVESCLDAPSPGDTSSAAC